MDDVMKEPGQVALNSLSEAGLLNGVVLAARHLRDVGLLPPHPTAEGNFVMKVELGPDHGFVIVCTEPFNV